MKGNEMPPLMRPAAGVRPILIAGKEVIMEILELKKKANEVRRGILTAVHAAKSGHPAVHSPLLIFLHICILKK